MPSKQELIDFENSIAEIYKSGVIRGAIHLRDGNEDVLIDIFKNVKSEVYVFATWANHLEALLKGIPPESVRARIMAGDSMAMNFPDYNFYTSAIVGGICPIAVGVAAGLQMKSSDQRVWCFIGDMALRTGIAHESIMYSIGHDLPISFVVADNGKSVCTPTQKVWGSVSTTSLVDYYTSLADYTDNGFAILYYEYESKFSHSGVGQFVSF